MIKIGDNVLCNKRGLTGQVLRIREQMVTIIFVTDEKIKKNLKDIINVNGQWRIND